MDIEIEKDYELIWKGKRYSKFLSTTPSDNKLMPLPEESVNFDTTENLFIEGDNLEVLKLLQEDYYNKIKMIYIDPPYNTGSNFIYKDVYNQTVDEDVNRFISNFKISGRFHSDWLSMMLPRLRMARNLLSNNGVIFISISYNEQTNLKLLCEEVFGEGQVEVYVWNIADFEESSFTKTASSTVRYEHEYLIACYKGNKKLGRYKEQRLINRDDLTNLDNDPRGDWFSGNISRNGITTTTGSKYYTITTPTGVEYTRNWTLSREEFNDLIADNRIYFANNGDGVPRQKIFKDTVFESIQSSIFSGVKSSITGKNQVSELFDNIKVFDFPKPTNLIYRLATLVTNENDIVLDFFAGSGTTAHAVMGLNAEDGGNRKFIMVQLPEEIPEDHTAREFGAKNIADISKERIRRAGQKILEEECHENWDRDIGFKVLKCI